MHNFNYDGCLDLNRIIFLPGAEQLNCREFRQTYHVNTIIYTYPAPGRCRKRGALL